MKKLLPLFFICFSINLGFSQTFTDANGLNYGVLTSNPAEVTVTGGTVSTPFIIPSTATDSSTNITYKVVDVGNSGFRDNSGLTKITLDFKQVMKLVKK